MVPAFLLESATGSGTVPVTLGVVFGSGEAWGFTFGVTVVDTDTEAGFFAGVLVPGSQEAFGGANAPPAVGSGAFAVEALVAVFPNFARVVKHLAWAVRGVQSLQACSKYTAVS